MFIFISTYWSLKAALVIAGGDDGGPLREPPCFHWLADVSAAKPPAYPLRTARLTVLARHGVLLSEGRFYAAQALWGKPSSLK